MVNNLKYGIQEISASTIEEHREFGKPNEQGGHDIYARVSCVIYANQSINFTMHVTNQSEFENFKELIQPQIDKFVSDMKTIAAEQGVPVVNI